MTPISCVIITFNEEKNIERCIKSVQEIADEILVVDSFSTDKTREICARLGVTFVEHIFEGHIEQKNWAKEQAKHNLVLSLDADEELSETLKASILEVKNDLLADGYEMSRLTNYCSSWIKHGNWYPDVKLRLWKKDKGNWGGLNPHDKFIMDKNAHIIRLKGDLLHYSFYNFDEHLKQIHKFTDISSDAAIKAGKKASVINLVTNPLAKFIGGYFLKLGILDGAPGFRIAWYSAYATYLKYSKILQKKP